jgi:hypothetical protein
MKFQKFSGVGKLGDRLIVMLDISKVLAPEEAPAAEQFSQGEENA